MRYKGNRRWGIKGIKREKIASNTERERTRDNMKKEEWESKITRKRERRRFNARQRYRKNRKKYGKKCEDKSSLYSVCCLLEMHHRLLVRKRPITQKSWDAEGALCNSVKYMISKLNN